MAVIQTAMGAVTLRNAQEVTAALGSGLITEAQAADLNSQLAPTPEDPTPVPTPVPESAAAGDLNSIGAIIAAGNRGALSAQQAFDALMVLLGPGAWQQASRLILKADFPDNPVSVSPEGVVALAAPSAEQQADLLAQARQAGPATARVQPAEAFAEAQGGDAQAALDALARGAQANVPPGGQVGPYTRYLISRNVGAGEGQIPFGSPAQRFLGTEFERLQDLQPSSEAIRSAQGLPILEDFGDFAGQFPTPTLRRGRAAEVLQGLFGLTPEQRADFGLTFERSFDADDVPFYEGAGLRSTAANPVGLTNLVQAGLRQSAGKFGSRFVAGRLPSLQERFEFEQPSVGGVRTPFLGYLQAKLGL